MIGNYLIITLCVSYCHVSLAHILEIPSRYDNWAEPDSEIYDVNSEWSKRSRQNALERLTALRQVMAARNVDAYIVPTADAHNSQYISETDARREWLSGLSGSSGTAVVTAADARVWTDARYFTQFDMQVDTDHWKLMKQGTDPSIADWLAETLTNGSVVAVDPTTYTRAAWTPLQSRLASSGISLLPVSENLVDLARVAIEDPPPPRDNNPLIVHDVKHRTYVCLGVIPVVVIDALTSRLASSRMTLLAVSENLVDLARVAIEDPPPPRDNNPLIVHDAKFTGKPSMEKITTLLKQIEDRGAAALVLTALDDIAYTLNLRGTDIPYNPVFFAYLVIRVDRNPPNNVILFWGNGTLAAEVEAHLRFEGTQLETRPYGQIFDYLKDLASSLPSGSTIWLSDEASHAVFTALEEGGSANLISSVTPVALAKCVKNEVELEGFRKAHIKDGTAVVRFLHWVHSRVDAGENVTEINVVDKLYQLRAEEADFMGASFATIAGTGEHGAVIHYKPDRDGEQRVIRTEDMLLVDSGGHYRDGTTDITRTRHMSSPTPEQRRAFTRVLKGQIMMGTAVFPRGIVGHRLETLARKALWDVGLNYAHGTGHGVGQFLNVHEGPSWILSGPVAADPGIVPGMTFSNEPGYYEVDEYGIRHEDLVEVIQLTKTSDHIRAAGLVGDFSGAGALGFHTISLAPQQRVCIDVDLLTDFELKFLNDYHARVLSTIGPILLERGLTEDHKWLEEECAPLLRSAAVTLVLAPILVVISVCSSFLSV